MASEQLKKVLDLVKSQQASGADEMVHVWHIFAKLLPEAQQAIEKIGAYVIVRAS